MKAIRPTALAPLAFIAVIGTAEAAGRFDGSWSVVATGDESSCAGPYKYPIVIRDGQVDDAGGNDVDATGRAGSDGGISGTIRRGLAVVSVSGKLKGRGGSGRWTLSGLGSCSGRWTARRTS